MSDLLNKASLVMIPSGYKEDVVYSQIPTSGSGDLSFTRASNGTRVNSAGLVEVCPWNEITYSEQFQNSAWTKQNSGTTYTLTDNFTTAPNGTNTACKYTWTAMDSAGKYFSAYQTFYLPSNQYTFSVYMKGAVGGEKLYIYNYPTYTATLCTLTTEWQRFSVTVTTDQQFFYIGGEFGYGGMTTLPAGTAYIWGAQLNIGSTAKPYFPTTDRLNVPRLTYQNGGGGCPSLLLEKQSTNLLSYSQDFTQSYWSKTSQGVGSNAVVTANYAISPDGTQNATRLVCNLNGGTTTNDRSWMLANFSSDPTTTLSIWIKLNSAGTKTFIFSDSGGNTKTISGTDWQRIDSTFTGGSGEFRIGLIGGLGTSDTLDCCIWGAQAEGGSYATSLIQTTSSSATRVADVAYKTSATALIGQTEGTIFLDFVAKGLPAVDQYFLNLSDGSTANLIYIGFYANILVARIIDNYNLVVNINVSLSTNTRYKVAFAYKANDCILYINGTNSGSDTIATIPATSVISLNDFSEYGTFEANEAIVSKTRLTNAELASLTTI